MLFGDELGSLAVDEEEVVEEEVLGDEDAVAVFGVEVPCDV